MSTTFGCLDFSRIAICTASASQAPHDQHHVCQLRSRQVDQSAAWRTTFALGAVCRQRCPLTTTRSCILMLCARMAHATSSAMCCTDHVLVTHLVHECADFLLPQAARLQHLDSHRQHIVQASSENCPKRPCTPAQGTQAPS